MAVADRDHAHGDIHVVRRDGLPRQCLGLLRSGDQGDLGDVEDLRRRFRARGDAHADAGGEADGFELLHQSPVGVDLGREFGALGPESRRVDEHDGQGGVDHGNGNRPDARHLELFHHLAGGQQPGAARAAGIEEFEAHRRAGAADAGQGEIAVHRRQFAVHGETRDDDLAGIGIVDANHGVGALGRRDEPLIDGEGADGGGHVAAIAAGIDGGFPHQDLDEGVIDIGVGAARRADDADLRQRRYAAAHAVELAPVGIGAAHGGEEDGRPKRLVLRQILGAQHDGVGRAAAHENGAQPHLFHLIRSSMALPCCAFAALAPAMRPNTAPDTRPVPPG